MYKLIQRDKYIYFKEEIISGTFETPSFIHFSNNYVPTILFNAQSLQKPASPFLLAIERKAERRMWAEMFRGIRLYHNAEAKQPSVYEGKERPRTIDRVCRAVRYAIIARSRADRMSRGELPSPQLS